MTEPEENQSLEVAAAPRWKPAAFVTLAVLHFFIGGLTFLGGLANASTADAFAGDGGGAVGEAISRLFVLIASAKVLAGICMITLGVLLVRRKPHSSPLRIVLAAVPMPLMVYAGGLLAAPALLVLVAAIIVPSLASRPKGGPHATSAGVDDFEDAA